MRVAYDDGEELLHPLTERWRAEGASDSEEGAEAEQGPADTKAESNSDDDSEHYLPGPDVRLVRNVWTRGGVDARVKAVKYMWALFACNDLLFRRFDFFFRVLQISACATGFCSEPPALLR